MDIYSTIEHYMNVSTTAVGFNNNQSRIEFLKSEIAKFPQNEIDAAATEMMESANKKEHAILKSLISNAQ